MKWARVFRGRDPHATWLKLPVVPAEYVCSPRGELEPPSQKQLEKESVRNAYDEYEIATRYVFDGRTWKTNGATITHGYTVIDNGVTMVFLESQDPPVSPFDDALATQPDNADLVRIWADWLLERGHRLGPLLASGQPQLGVLEGLSGLLEDGNLSLVVKHGLIREAVLTRCEAPFPARLVTLPIARWVQKLTFDGPKFDAAMLISLLVNGPQLPGLELLSFGYTKPALLQTREFQLAWGDLRKRSPRLAAGPMMFRPVTRAELRVSDVPTGVRFKSPLAMQGRIALNLGVWVGRPQPDLLIAVDVERAPSLANASFEIRPESSPTDTSPRWVLRALGPSVFINGQRLWGTGRYLRNGDRIDDATGARFTAVVE